MNRVWVVEMLTNPSNGRYDPTVGMALTQQDAVVVLKDWRARNPDDKFRLRQYYAAPEKQMIQFTTSRPMPQQEET